MYQLKFLTFFTCGKSKSRTNQYEMYDYNPKYTQSASDPLLNKIYANDNQLFGEARSYRIRTDSEGLCTLIPNHQRINKEPVREVSPKDLTYVFVIILDKKTNQLQLRIGEGSHHLVANKAKKVVAAGTLRFIDKKLVEITNQSGAYHVDMEELSQKKQDRFYQSLTRALNHVNLPIDKLVLFKKEKTEEPAGSYNF
ncbi:hypothetical protein [Legionella maioricensis]|uniref:Uncharacterized protein n=1 Tax=Legionella maioricensis TaxID=2896528 RepID=A0A9X2D2K2_9GAMM|nr:hypothetical protein [Legionella maioricensis]MCL9685068.1 hypothetical protein [Legionella maioricensis]MCL9688171.1 hypothetical protein [Legionella maioricensis]